MLDIMRRALGIERKSSATTRIEVESKDELGQLTADFNTMAQTLKSYEHMRRQWISDIVFRGFRTRCPARCVGPFI